MITTISFSKKRQIINLSICIIGLLITLFLISKSNYRVLSGAASEYPGQKRNILLGFSVLFGFTWAAILILKDMYSNKKAIILDNSGIAFNSIAGGGKYIGTVKWKDVSAIYISTTKNKTYLNLSVNNPWDYYNKIPNNTTANGVKAVLEKNIKNEKTLLKIPASVVDIELVKLLDIINERYLES